MRSVVLIHFPMATYLSGTLFDFVARVFRKPNFREVARWNFLFAAVMSIRDRCDRNSRLALGFRRTAPERHPSLASLAGWRGGFCAVADGLAWDTGRNR
jgi:hypothetical protein